MDKGEKTGISFILKRFEGIDCIFTGKYTIDEEKEYIKEPYDFCRLQDKDGSLIKTMDTKEAKKRYGFIPHSDGFEIHIRIVKVMSLPHT